MTDAIEEPLAEGEEQGADEPDPYAYSAMDFSYGVDESEAYVPEDDPGVDAPTDAPAESESAYTGYKEPASLKAPREFTDRGTFREANPYGGIERGADGSLPPVEGASDDDFEETDEPSSRFPRPSRRVAIAAGVALVGIIAAGLGGYLPIESPVDTAALVRLLPFTGGADEHLTELEDNVLAVQAAIDSYADTYHALPSSPSSIEKELKALKLTLKNPYDEGAPVTIELADVPSQPGAIACAMQPRRYELRVGDAAGRSLAIKGSEFVVLGQMGAHVARRPTMLAAVPSGTPTSLPVGGGPAAVPGVPAIAADASPAPGASLTPEQRMAERLKVNLAFDTWRIRGISKVYEGHAQEAIADFKQALALRPGDEGVTQWVTVVQGVIDKNADERRAKYQELREAAYKEAASRAAQYVPPPDVPAVPTERPHPPEPDDAQKLLDELRRGDHAPLLAPPSLDN